MRLFLFVFSAFSLSASPSEDALTHYIVSQVLERVKADFPGQTPAAAFPVKRAAPYLFSGDTLYVPEGLWGYQVTNDYRLHFYAAHLLYFRALHGSKGEGSADSFFLHAGRAAVLASAYVASLEKKDSILSDLLPYYYLFQRHLHKMPGLVIRRDRERDSLRYLCLVKAALAYRCDSLHSVPWLNTDDLPEYGITRVTQTPLRRRQYRLEGLLSNSGRVPAPFRLYFNGAGGDTSLYFNGFLGDTAFSLDWPRTLLKIVLDPEHRLLDLTPGNQQFISTEFLRKRRVAASVAFLIWDALSAGAAFAGLFLCGIIFPPVLRLFYGNNRAWAGLFTLAFAGIKISIPPALFGFNLWGLVYLIHLASTRFSTGLLAAGAAGVSAGLYALLQRDGLVMTRYRGFLIFIFSLIFLEPLLWIFWL